MSAVDAEVDEVASSFMKAVFIEDVDEYLKSQGSTVEEVLSKLQEQYSHYKLWETKLMSSRKSLQNKMPEIRRALDAVIFLEKKQQASESVSVHFDLSDAVYANATFKDVTAVGLWLGANVMLEYPFDEANALLNKNMTTAKESLATVEKDLSFIKDQITTTEVSMARVYNADVKRRRLQKQATGTLV